MKDIDKLKELMELVEKNPDLEVMTMVYNEIVCEDHGYWTSKIGEIKKDIYFNNDDERIYIGIDDIKEQLSDSASLEPEFDDMDDNDFEIMIENEIELKKQSGEIKEAIIIYIELP